MHTKEREKRLKNLIVATKPSCNLTSQKITPAPGSGAVCPLATGSGKLIHCGTLALVDSPCHDISVKQPLPLQGNCGSLHGYTIGGHPKSRQECIELVERSCFTVQESIHYDFFCSSPREAGTSSHMEFLHYISWKRAGRWCHKALSVAFCEK